MSDKELTLLIKEISLKYFKREFSHNANFNSRLKTTGGRFHLKDGHIDINPKVLDFYDKKILIGIILHELCHYHLYYEKKGYKHSSTDFKNLLKKVGGLKYAPPFREKNKRKTYKIYHCEKCGLRYQRVRKIDTQKYVCGKCKGKLVFDFHENKI